MEGEIFFLKSIDSTTFEALIRPGKKLRPGCTFSLGDYHFQILSATDSGRLIRISGGDIFSCMEAYGRLPLPPYIDYSPEKEADYQSIFAQQDGSVAAPTASLHFTEELLTRLPNECKTLTLHIGLGTFQSIQTEDIRDYTIHAEAIDIPYTLFRDIAQYKYSGRPLTAVGTTATRALESMPAVWKHIDPTVKKTL